MKKLINNPDAVAAEAIEGLALAYPQYLRKLDGLMAVVRADAPVAGKVAVLTGGGSGHEPMFAGFVGRGWADGSVAGNIFTSPPPQPIYETAKAIHGGAGVLLLYGNYSGDVLNFDMAAEMLTEDGFESPRCASVTMSPPHPSRPGVTAAASLGISSSSRRRQPQPRRRLTSIRSPTRRRRLMTTCGAWGWH